MNEPILEAKKLCKAFGSLLAVQDVSLDIKKDEIHAITRCMVHFGPKFRAIQTQQHHQQGLNGGAKVRHALKLMTKHKYSNDSVPQENEGKKHHKMNQVRRCHSDCPGD